MLDTSCNRKIMKYPSFMIDDILDESSNRIDTLLKASKNCVLDEEKPINLSNCSSKVTNSIKKLNQDQTDSNQANSSAILSDNHKFNNLYLHHLNQQLNSNSINQIYLNLNLKSINSIKTNQTQSKLSLNLDQVKQDQAIKNFHNLNFTNLSPTISTLSSSSSSPSFHSFAQEALNQFKEFSTLQSNDFHSMTSFESSTNDKFKFQTFKIDCSPKKSLSTDEKVTLNEDYVLCKNEEIEKNLCKNETSSINYVNQSEAPYYIQQLYIKMKMLMQAKPRKGGQIRFNHQQTNELENMFNSKKYLVPSERKQIAKKLALSERQVKTWFQNRRAKWRKLKNYLLSKN